MNATIPASSLANPANPIPFAVLDRALVAICCGWNRRNDGNGIGYAPAWEEATLAELEALGFVKRERRPIGTDLVWMTETLTRTATEINERAYELVTFKGGRTEVYVEYADEPGLMQFRGYYDEVCVSDRATAEVVHPLLSQHQAAHRDFWATYLPGAASWLRAAA